MVGSGSGLAQLLVVASTPVLTRLYPPEAYAIWAMFVSMTALFSSIAALRLELAVVLPRDQADALRLLGAGAGVSVVIAFLATGICLLIGRNGFSVEVGEALRPWFGVLPFFFVSFAIYQLSLSWCTRQRSFGWLAALQIALPLGTVAIQMLGGLVWPQRATGLIAGTVVGQVFAAAIAIWAARDAWAQVFATVNWSATLATLQRHRAYPLYMTPYALLGATRERFVYFMLGRIATPLTLGYYSLGARLAQLPTGLVSSSIRPVFFQHAASRPLQESETLVLLLITELGFISFPFWAIFSQHASFLMGVVFGPAWSEAGVYSVILTAPILVLLLGCWADRMFDVLGRQRAALGFEVAFTVSSIGGLLLAYSLSHNLLGAIAAQAAVMGVCYTIWFTAIFRYAGYQVSRLWRVLTVLGLWLGVSILAMRVLGEFLPETAAVAVGLLLAIISAGMRVKHAIPALRALS